MDTFFSLYFKAILYNIKKNIVNLWYRKKYIYEEHLRIFSIFIERRSYLSLMVAVWETSPLVIVLDEKIKKNQKGKEKSGGIVGLGWFEVLSVATRVEPKSDLSIHWGKEMSTQSNKFKV